MIIEPRLWPDQGRQINHLAAGRGFGEAQGSSQRGGHCTICERFIDAGEPDFIIIFKDAVTLRLDQACMDLWHEEAERPESPS